MRTLDSKQELDDFFGPDIRNRPNPWSPNDVVRHSNGVVYVRDINGLWHRWDAPTILPTDAEVEDWFRIDGIQPLILFRRLEQNL